jgi:hypothetical protein
MLIHATFSSAPACWLERRRGWQPATNPCSMRQHAITPSLDLGEVSQLSFQGVALSSVSGANTGASAEIVGETATLAANAPSELVLPGGNRIASVSPKQ